MKAGKTDIEIGTKIKTTKTWDKKVITGTITHPFGCFGFYDYGAIAGIRVDQKYQHLFGEIGNLFRNDFVVLPNRKTNTR